MLGNSNLSQKTIILGAITFYLPGYIITVIALFNLINFGTVSLKDSFLDLLFGAFFGRPAWDYPLFYILPLLLVGYITRLWRGKLFWFIEVIFPPLLSFLIAYLSYGVQVLAHGVGVGGGLVLKLFPIQLISCLTLTIIFYFKKEKIFPKLMLINLIFFLATLVYISVPAKVASEAEPILKELSQKAIEAKDASLCEKIIEESEKRKIFKIRRVDKKKEILFACRGLCEHYYINCITGVGLVEEDEFVCEKLPTERERAECQKKVFLKTTNLCKNVLEEEKVKCIQQIAIQTNDIELCKKILGGVECIAPIAVNTKNLNLCFSEEINYPLSWEPNPYACFEEVFKYTGDVNLCNQLDELKHPYYKDGCLSAAATQLANPQLCEEVGESNYQYACYDDPNTSPRVCLPDTDKTQCFIDFFRKTKNSQVCQNITEGVNRDVCYYAAAIELKDYNLCEQIKEKTWKEWCRKGP